MSDLGTLMSSSTAWDDEEAAWALAGIVPGAHCAEIGCGPGVVLSELARVVGPEGSVVGVDPSPASRAAAQARIDSDGYSNVSIRDGRPEETGLEPGTFDVVMQRNVLLYNGGRETMIVEHLKSLVRPAGTVYLVETDLDAVRFQCQTEPARLQWERWRDAMRECGNDVNAGARLAELALHAGLEVTDLDARFDVFDFGGDETIAFVPVFRVVARKGR